MNNSTARFLFVLIAASLILSACGSAAPETPAATATPEPAQRFLGQADDVWAYLTRYGDFMPASMANALSGLESALRQENYTAIGPAIESCRAERAAWADQLAAGQSGRASELTEQGFETAVQVNGEIAALVEDICEAAPDCEPQPYTTVEP